MYKVNVYTVPDESAKKIATNFTVREFACKDGSPVVFVNPQLINILQEIRQKVAKPVAISSAFRTYSHNKQEGGSTKSQHMYGNAADIHVTGMKASELAKVCDKIVGDKGAVIEYPTFVHVDVRGYRWRAKSTT